MRTGNDYWELVKPTYIENWATGLYNLSFAQVDIPLTIEEALNLGSNMVELFECFDVKPLQDITTIISKLNNAVVKFTNGFFVRLGSRSPKDSWQGHENGFKCVTADDALKLLLDCSERIMEDLLLAISQNYPPHIWLRQWVDIPKWSEFRCFARDKRLVAISQYNYLGNERWPELYDYADSIKWAIEGFTRDYFMPVSHLDSVIFDVYVREKKRGNTSIWETRLIEINPYFEMTDPCLFSWNRQDEFNGQLRYVGEHGKVEEA